MSDGNRGGRLDANTPAVQALEKAYHALQRGDKQAARAWAQEAASMQPDWEDPWLVLAAISNPHAGEAYLKKALELNPESPRARAGLDWIRRQPASQPGSPSRRGLPRHPSLPLEYLANPGRANRKKQATPPGASHNESPFPASVALPWLASDPHFGCGLCRLAQDRFSCFGGGSAQSHRNLSRCTGNVSAALPCTRVSPVRCRNLN